MTRYSALAIICATGLACASTGFVCSMSKTRTFTLKRYSSIPPIVRWTVFTSDCEVTILDPPKTTRPFTYSMASGTCDTLEKLCAAYATFDSVYAPEIYTPNPSSMDLEFQRDGIVKTVHIAQSPKLPAELMALLKFAGRIEYVGLEMMEKQGGR